MSIQMQRLERKTGPKLEELSGKLSRLPNTITVSALDRTKWA